MVSDSKGKVERTVVGPRTQDAAAARGTSREESKATSGVAQEGWLLSLRRLAHAGGSRGGVVWVL